MEIKVTHQYEKKVNGEMITIQAGLVVDEAPKLAQELIEKDMAIPTEVKTESKKKRKEEK